MAEVDTAQDATDLAIAFLKPHWAFVRPLRAKRRRDVWTVDVDVGTRWERLAWVKVSADTGKVVDYNIPSESSNLPF